MDGEGRTHAKMMVVGGLLSCPPTTTIPMLICMVGVGEEHASAMNHTNTHNNQYKTT